MKRWLAGFLMGFSLVLCLSRGAAVMAQTPSLIEDTTQTSGMIRVALTSIGGKGTYNLTVSGSYTCNGIALESGAKVKVEFSNGAIYVTANGSRQSMGSAATLSRKSGGVKIAESLVPSNLYPGDMRFVYSGGKAYVICYLFVEDYVGGVLPYEMDNSFPLEALKAQAVTARTYAMRAKTTAGVYDVTDTTNHQVFRGVNSDKARCIQAVNETWGIVLKHNGKYVEAFYSASNGGQTELNNHVWGGTRLPYFSTADDPYDTANAMAVKKSYYVYKNPSQGSSISAYAMIKSALASNFGGSTAQYSIESISGMTLHTPMYAVPSKLYTKLRVDVVYNGGQSASVDIPIFTSVEKSLGLSINASNNELYTIDSDGNGYRITARRYGHGVGMSQRGAQQMADSGLSYAQILAFYYTGVQRVRMQLMTEWPSEVVIPQGAEEPIAASYKATVALLDADGRLNLRKDQSAQSEVLLRIPNGAEVLVLSQGDQYAKIQYQNETGFVAAEYLEAVAAPPTPVTAKVSLESGTLNLRAEPNESAEILSRIPNGETCYLLETDGDWSRISYLNQTGYVLSKLISTSAQEAGGQSGATATVALPNPGETVNFRQSPSMDAPVLALLPNDTALLVLESSPEWTHVSYQGMAGYVMTSFLRTGGAQFLPQITPSVELPTNSPQMATVTLQSGRLNVRKQPNDTSDIVTKLEHMTKVEVLLLDDMWCTIRVDGDVGYVLRKYLSVVGTPTLPETASGAPATTSAAQSDYAYVKTADGDRVNLRRSASTSSTVLIRVPNGSKVDVLSYEPEWSKVRYESYTGYVSTEYLAFDLSGGADISAKAGETIWARVENGEAVNLRKEPDQKAQSLALIPDGSELMVLSVQDGWVKVIYKGLTGYVMDTFVGGKPTNASRPVVQNNENAAAVEPAREQPAALRETVVGDAKTTVLGVGKIRLNSPTAMLHLKALPDDLADDAGIIKHGAGVEILQYYENDSLWMFVRSGNISGYALAEHIVTQ